MTLLDQLLHNHHLLYGAIFLVAAIIAKAASATQILPVFGKGSRVAASTKRALPSAWYRSEEVYELERRAIFSKKWLLVTHRLRFTENGSWIRFKEAGYAFFLVRNDDGEIKGFHNVCRHRAFPIVTKDQGKSHVLSCQYHGWSYGLNGQLAKAPGYSDMKGFNRSKNGLLPIHVHIDANGFIWVNLDASQKPEPFQKEFNKIDAMARHKPFNFEDYHFDHIWEMSGDYNWKTLADNYNECYHCKTAHPDAAAVADLSSYKVDNKGGNIEHFANTNQSQADSGLTIVSNYYFPNACMTVSPNFFYMMRCVPTSVSHCSMEYEVYRHKSATNEDFDTIDSMFKRILSEDKYLCNEAQKNLNAGVFVNGEMHPGMEAGPLYFQRRIRELVSEHHEREKSTGKVIAPAQQILPTDATGTSSDLAMCDDMLCTRGGGELEW
ncbi:ISP domain-containing protein [Sarocladium strictum]